MKVLQLCLFLSLQGTWASVLPTPLPVSNDNPEAEMSVPQVIRFNNFPFEQHTVDSPDGFSNVLHRIPWGRRGSSSVPRPPVILFHGLSSSSAIWLENGPHQSLGFILADRGFDVWMANQRGNTYSSQNRFYSSNDSRYWDFSFQESALIDLPLMIDYILKTTGFKKLFYIGYSMGTTVGFMLLSSKIEYNDKIYAMLDLAPVADFQFNKNPFLRALSVLTALSKKLLDIIGNKGVDVKLIRGVASPLCNNPQSVRCLTAITAISGDSNSQFSTSPANVYLSHFPDRTSTKNIIHYGQIYNSGKFQAFDYGKDKNVKVYNQSTPPKFNLSRITAPVALYWSQSDKLAVPSDEANIKRKLRNVRQTLVISNTGFGHFSFIGSTTASHLLYPQMIHFMEGFGEE